MRYLLLLILCALAATPGLAAAQERSYVFEQIAVELTLAADGELEVVERYTYRFTGGPFQRALRGIPRDGVDAIRDVQLSEDGREYQSAFRGEEPGTYIVENNADELLVRWFYPPTSDAARTFTLSYTVDGAIFVDETYDELWWVAIFPERDVPVERSSVTLRLPEGAALAEADVSLPGAEADAQVRPEQVTVTRDEPLPPGEALELRVELDPDLIAAPVPVWQQQGDAPPADGPAPAESFPDGQPAPSGGGGAFDLFFCLIVALILIFVVLPLINRLMSGGGGWGGGYGGGGWGGGGWGGGYGGGDWGGGRSDRGGGWGGWGGSSGGSGGRSSSGWGRGNRSGGSWGGGRSAGSFGGGRSGGSWGGGSRRSSGGSRGGRRSGGGRGGAG